MEGENIKHVNFDDFCHKCEYRENLENEDPCNRCLTIPARQYSHKPEYFKERKHVNKE